MELAKLKVPVCVHEHTGMQIEGFNVPMNDEYDSRHRLSMVVSSTVPLAMRSMIRVFALSR
jgi:hypothetical protein